MSPPSAAERALWALRGWHLVSQHPLGYFVVEEPLPPTPRMRPSPVSTTTLTRRLVLDRDGHYVGDVAEAIRLCGFGITPELAQPHHRTCSIGFSVERQKWYGWSHRALRGFGLGDRSFPSHLLIATLEGARASAVAFAEDVG